MELNQQYGSPTKQWELLKLAIRNSTLQYAAHKAKSNKNKIAILEKKLKEATCQVDNAPAILLRSKQHQLSLVRQELAELNNVKMKGAIMRSRARWETLAEKPTKYFLSLEKRNFVGKTIYRLRAKDGNIITDAKGILQEQENFYRQLYTSVGETDHDYQNDIRSITPKVTLQEFEMLEAPIQKEEISIALKNLANSRSPGTDGLPADIYKVFYGKIKNLLFDTYKQNLNEHKMYLSARRGIISLLEKVGKDNLELKSWRPLTLLNMDYKILSKTLASRLQTVLQRLIHHDQTGFLPQRYMAENVLKMIDLMEYCRDQKQSAIVLNLDFEKAFDKLEWSAIYAAMSNFGIGPNFIEMIRTLYTDPISCTTNNGYWSNWFSPT